MKKISVLLTQYSDWLSCLIFLISGLGYTHISLALEEDDNRFYSFNYRGFCIETVEKHRRRGVYKSLTYQIEIPESVYSDIKMRIQDFEQQKTKFYYTKAGVFCAVFQIPFKRKYGYICSQFVAELLSETGAINLHKANNLYLPNQLCAEIESCAGFLKKIWNPI